MTEIPSEFSEIPELCKAIELTQEASYTRGELEAYDQYWDAVSTEKTIKVDARAEGKAEGITEGITKGIAEGKRAIALEMLIDNELDSKIMKYAKITLEELERLKKFLQK